MSKLEQLLDRAENARRKVRLRSIVEIGLEGKKANEAVPTLARLLTNEPDEQVRQTLVAALGDIGGPEARDAIIAAENDDSPSVRASVAISLRKVGEEERGMTLFESLATSNEQTDRSAARNYSDFFFRDGDDIPEWMDGF